MDFFLAAAGFIRPGIRGGHAVSNELRLTDNPGALPS